MDLGHALETSGRRRIPVMSRMASARRCATCEVVGDEAAVTDERTPPVVDVRGRVPLIAPGPLVDGTRFWDRLSAGRRMELNRRVSQCRPRRSSHGEGDAMLVGSLLVRSLERSGLLTPRVGS